MDQEQLTTELTEEQLDALAVQVASKLLDSGADSAETEDGKTVQRADSIPAQVKAVDPAQAGEKQPEQKFAAPAVHPQPERKLESFSIAAAIRGKIYGDWRGAELEREWCRANPSYGVEKATLDSADDLYGGFLVPSVTASGIISMVKAKAQFYAAGATVIQNAPYHFMLNTQESASSGYWIGMEAQPGAITASDLTFGQVEMRLRRCAGRVVIDEDLLRASNEAVESLVRQDLAEQIALAEDAAFYDGTGGTQPLGLLNWPGISSYTTDNSGSKITGDLLLTRKANIEGRNGDYSGWMTHPTQIDLIRKLKTGDSEYILIPSFWEGEKKMILGMNYYASTQYDNDKIILGNFSDCVIAEGGGIEIRVLKDGSYGEKLQHGIIGVHRVDFALRRTVNFDIISNLATS